MPDGQVVTMQANMGYRAVRMHHPDLRNCTFTVEDTSKRYPEPFPCPRCVRFHVFKTHHYELDANGDVTVSEQMYEKFKAAGFEFGMTAVKEVIPRPHAIGLSKINEDGEALDQSSKFVIAQEHGAVRLHGAPVEAEN